MYDEDYEIEGPVPQEQRKGKNYVEGGNSGQVHPLAPHRTSMHVFHAARQVVNVHTSAKDRAIGYLLIFTPVSASFGVLVLAATIALWDFPLLSLAAFLVFWGSFILTWLAGLVVVSLWTPEYISWYEARRKWDVIAEEQKERWAYYRWQAGMDKDDEPARSTEFNPFIVFSTYCFLVIATLLLFLFFG